MGRITDIIERVRDALSDPNADRWTDPRLLRLIDEGQKSIATRTQCLRTRTHVSLTKQKSLYTVSTTCDTISRILLGGKKVKLRSRAYMDDKYGLDWEYHTTDLAPWEVVYDKTNRKTLTVYPISSALEVEVYSANSDYGVTVSITGYESSSDYGLASSLSVPVTEVLTHSSDYGIIGTIEDVLSAMVVYHTEIPITLTDTTDELEVDDLFDTALKYFVVGMAFRDDQDAHNKELGNEALQFYSSELIKFAKDSAKDYIENADQHNQGYNPGAF